MSAKIGLVSQTLHAYLKHLSFGSVAPFMGGGDLLTKRMYMKHMKTIQTSTENFVIEWKRWKSLKLSIKLAPKTYIIYLVMPQ